MSSLNPLNRSKVAVLGAGSWGTAIAVHLSRTGHEVTLWGRDTDSIRNMQIDRRNTRYLPEYDFPETMQVSSHLKETLDWANDVLVAVPSHGFSALLSQMSPPKLGVSWLTKGLNPVDHRFFSDVIADKWGHDYPTAAISGPSFAKEVMNNLPTALTVASRDISFQKHIQTLLHHGSIRVYTSPDLIGVQWCGVVKNIIALACGVSDGLGYGANARAALITRGVAEMARLGKALGASEETFMGLAGIGDMILTCTDNQSRNRRFGLLLGQGMEPDAAQQQIGQVVEGSKNANQVVELAQHYTIDVPICVQVNEVLKGNVSVEQAVYTLMNRPMNAE